MTLFVVPSMYSLLNSRHEKEREKEAARRVPADAPTESE
jgi:hypothetical protein